jgi:hypothetical protein
MNIYKTQEYVNEQGLSITEISPVLKRGKKHTPVRYLGNVMVEGKIQQLDFPQGLDLEGCFTFFQNLVDKQKELKS